MMGLRCNALVLFGITGDLAYRKIFPALQALARRGDLDLPIIGMAREGWSRERLLQRVRDGLRDAGGLDPEVFAALAVASNTWAATIVIPPRMRACAGRSATASGRCTIWPSHRACSRP